MNENTTDTGWEKFEATNPRSTLYEGNLYFREEYVKNFIRREIQQKGQEEYERGRKDEREMFVGVLGDFVRTYSVNAPQESRAATFNPKQFMTTLLFRIDEEEQRILRKKSV